MKTVVSWLEDERLWKGRDEALEYGAVSARSQDEFDVMVEAYLDGYASALGITIDGSADE